MLKWTDLAHGYEGGTWTDAEQHDAVARVYVSRIQPLTWWARLRPWIVVTLAYAALAVVVVGAYCWRMGI
jgi:hypothetical protein